MQMTKNLNIFNNIEKSPTPVFFLYQNKIEFANQAFAELAEYDPADLPGVPIQQLFAGDELQKIVQKDILDDQSGGENIVRMLTRNLDFKIILVSSFVINDSESRYLVFCRDITDSSLRQKKLAQAKLYVDSIFSNLDDGVIVIDAEKKIINLNNGALNYGIEKVSEIVELVTKNLNILSAGWADKYNRRIRFYHSSGKPVHISANIRKFIISGMFDVYIINFSDISRDVELENEVKEKNTILQEQFNRMDKELKFARNIQENMVPGSFRIVKDLEIHTEYLIANSMGGDYYDVQEDGNGRTMLAIFDVSGHGVASSLVVMMLKALLQALDLKKIKESSEIFYYLQHGFRDKIPGKHFVAAVVLLYEHASGKLNVCTGGNYLPLVIKKSDGSVKEIGQSGFPIGFIAKPHFESIEIEMQSGDKLLMFTDGIVEAKNRGNQFFSKERVISLVQSLNDKNAGFIKQKLFGELQEFTEHGLLQADDVTLMAIDFGQPEFNTQTINLSSELQIRWPAEISGDSLNRLRSLITELCISEFDLTGCQQLTLSWLTYEDNLKIRVNNICKKTASDYREEFSSIGWQLNFDEVSGIVQFSV